MPLEVYLDPVVVNGRKTLAGLKLIGASFTLHEISFMAEDHKSPSYLAINPNGTVPAAKDGDLRLTESNAILMYAVETTPSVSPLAYPSAPKQRADANCWLFWEQTSWFPVNYVYIVENVFRQFEGEQPDEAALKDVAPRWHDKAAILEARLKETKGWILGGAEPSIVDIAVGAPMPVPEKMKLPLEKYPEIRRWYADLSGVKCWRDTQVVVDQKLLGKE